MFALLFCVWVLNFQVHGYPGIFFTSYPLKTYNDLLYIMHWVNKTQNFCSLSN